jgi:membrane protein implicated in regulation of membrane protease activity
MKFNPNGLFVTAVGVAILALGLSGVSSVDVSLKVAMWAAVAVLSTGAVRAQIRGYRQKSN